MSDGKGTPCAVLRHEATPIPVRSPSTLSCGDAAITLWNDHRLIARRCGRSDFIFRVEGILWHAVEHGKQRQRQERSQEGAEAKAETGAAQARDFHAGSSQVSWRPRHELIPTHEGPPQWRAFVRANLLTRSTRQHRCPSSVPCL